MLSGASHGAPPPCDPTVRLRTAGLVPSLVSVLLDHRGRPVKAVFDCAGRRGEVAGVLEDAGVGFVTIRDHQSSVTILLDRLCWVESPPR